jgi:hypothetical protein
VLYFAWLRHRLAAAQAKYVLLAILLLSWFIPFATPELPNYTKMISEGKVFYENYTAWNVVDISDKSLIDCYNKAKDGKAMCDCEVLQKANLVTFKYDPFYHFMLQYSKPVLYAFAAIALLFLLEFLIKIGFLLYIIYASYAIKHSIDGTSYYLLYPKLKRELPLSAFSLWHHYVIWSPLLDELDEKEREAVMLHELTHLRQRDTWVQMLLQLTKVFWWILPTFYFLQKELNHLNEFVADEAAAKKMGSARRYASLLLKVKEFQTDRRKPHFAQAIAKGLLKKRVLHLINSSKQKALKPLHFAFYIVLIAAMLWGTAFMSLPEIQKQDLKVKQYELLYGENTKTGQAVFCKSCLQETEKK